MNRDYQHFEEEDFLLDESFTRYCLGTDVVAARFWQEWLEKHPEKKETARRAKELLLLLSGNHTTEQYRLHEQQLRSRFQQHLQGQSNPPTIQQEKKVIKPFISLKRVYIASALVVICAITLWVLYNGSKSSQPGTESYLSQTATGEHKFFRLPDGTAVTLNAGSTIRVLPSFNKTLREISLEGEALFDVTHDSSRPFIIHTTTMDVKVLGTILNVRAYADDKKTETTLIRGKVEVTLNTPGHKTIILHPHQKIVVMQNMVKTNDTQEKQSPRNDKNIYEIKELSDIQNDSTVNEILWARSKLAFDNERLEDIAATLEREFGYVITVDDKLKSNRYTGTFDNKSIEDILNALQLSQYFDYKILPGKKIIIETKQN